MAINFSALSDRLNPVLVKELRQATRSRAFTVVLLVGLGIASFLSVGILMDAASRGQQVSGEAMLMRLATIYTWLIRIYVILSAFQSTAEEFTEDTIDQLLLSSLSPWTIASGKFQASMVLILLLLSSFLPFAAVTFLMEGVGLQQLVIFIGIPTVNGVGLAALAVLAGSLARNKGLRILLVSILVMVVFMGGALSLLMTPMVGPGGMISGFMIPTFAITALGTVGHVVLLVAFASAALTPASEDRSSVPRRAFTFWAMIALFCVIAMESLGSMGFSFASSVSLGGLYLQTLPILALFLTERRGLPRSVKPLPRGKPLRHLRNLWLPGGDRAVGYFFVHLAGLMLVMLALTQTSMISSDEWLRSSFCFCLVATGWVLLPVTILSKLTANTARGRVAALVLLVALWVLAPMARSIAGFMVGRGFNRLDDSLNPFWLLTNTKNRTDFWDYRVTVALAVMAIAFQLVFVLRRWTRPKS